ncbi:response regulator transcription factor [Azospirillum halopraeferens]|uniref:response regulator transcription factor n=1 Tax=Azospirillum halopraeferens TaxID=34010 RepID=UPI0003FC7807|nr:response regulator [Azospirillum halopraeferens]
MVSYTRILLVDDSKLARMAMRAVVNDIMVDAEMLEAADAETALDMLEHDRFDVVFMDYNMPGVDGLSAATIIRERHPGASIALVTAMAQDSIVEEAGRLSISFITKPVRRQDVASFLTGA